jgi:hypothetical protein
MHGGLLPNGQVFFLDKLENYTQLKTPNGYYAMSSEYNPETNIPAPLTYVTNAFCSGGSYLADGRVINGTSPRFLCALCKLSSYLPVKLFEMNETGMAVMLTPKFWTVGGNAALPWLDPNIGSGFTAIRYLERSSTDTSFNGQGWSEPGNKLDSARWYASAQTMPDGTVFVASGSLNGLDPTNSSNNNPTYEILSPEGISVRSVTKTVPNVCQELWEC